MSSYIIRNYTNKRTFAPHGINAWYIDPTLEHYRCYKVYVPETKAKRICYTVIFHPHLCNSLVLQPLEQAIIAANRLTTALQQFEHQHAHIKDNQTIKALKTLSNIFTQPMQKKKEQNNAQSPRVSKAIHNPTTPAPMVKTQSPTPSPYKHIHVIPPEPALPTTAQPHRKHKYNARLSVA